MTELDQDSAELVALARDGLGPDDAALKRMRVKIATMTGASLVAAGSAAKATSAAAAAGGGVTAGLAVKIVAVVAIVGAGLGVTAHAISQRERPAVATVTPRAQPQLEPPLPRVTLAAPTLSPTTVPRPADLPRSVPIAPHPPHAEPPLATAPEPASQQTAPGAATNLAREIELVDEANAAMRAGRVHDARATIATYTAEIGDAGQLAEEAAGIEVEALCRLHAEAAPARRAAFERRYPHSLQRAKLAAACDEH